MLMTIQVFWYMVNRSRRFGRTFSISVTKQELFISRRGGVISQKTRNLQVPFS